MSQNSQHVLSVAMARSSSDSITLCTSGFLDYIMEQISQKQEERYVLTSLLSSGSSLTSDNTVWLSLPRGGTRGKVCRHKLHLLRRM